MAAPLISLEATGLVQGHGWLWRGLDLHIGERDRLALVGRNGAGKTTLLKALAGRLELDEGRRVVRPGTSVVMLDQDPSVDGFATLRDFALAAPAPPVHEVEAAADRLGVELDRDAATASGGEKRRAAIARALAQHPDVLLLDEPTNHLDIAAIEWLEAWLKRFNGAFVAISHDRTFLTRLTSASLWLDAGQLRRAEIGFGGFEAWTEAVAAEQARTAERLDTRLKQEEHWLQRGVTARRSRNMGRLARLFELRDERRALTGPLGGPKLAISADDARTKVVIDAEHVAKSFGDRTVIADLTLRIRRGDRIGVIGPNGAGKTTLLRLLTGGLEPDRGSIRRAETLTTTFIDQTRSRLLAPGATVRDVLADGGEWLEVGGVRKHIAGHLKDFLFDPGVVDAAVEGFSGGERSRLLLAREFARPAGLLVLDEPTNDLDLETLDLLQEVIAEYPGTVIVVSHDRDFLDRTVTSVVALDGFGGTEVVVGGWSDWAGRTVSTRANTASTAAKFPSTQSATPSRTAAGASTAVRKLSYIEQRDLDRLPDEIAAHEARIAAAEAALADPALYASNRSRFDRLTAELATVRAALAAAEDRWLHLEEKNTAISVVSRQA